MKNILSFMLIVVLLLLVGCEEKSEKDIFSEQVTGSTFASGMDGFLLTYTFFHKDSVLYELQKQNGFMKKQLLGTNYKISDGILTYYYPNKDSISFKYNLEKDTLTLVFMDEKDTIRVFRMDN